MDFRRARLDFFGTRPLCICVGACLIDLMVKVGKKEEEKKKREEKRRTTGRARESRHHWNGGEVKKKFHCS